MNERPSATPIQVLLIEDNPGDVFLIQEALREHGLVPQLSVIADGEEAVSFARREGQPAVRPDLILLDLNLPKCNGREVLQSIRGNPELARVPLVIFTSSDSPQDRLVAAEPNVSCYIRKPSNLEEFMQIGGVLKKLLLSTKTGT
ncbi:MAG TPA: response regulator [Candidatus Binatia bacterium]|jgi:CheY-like chemotaxis protein|nr:response regulator [Candidatus Binatia bacterium]